jgi:hypothetical protein
MPDWADPTWRRQHLRAWASKERSAHEHPSWAPARAQWAKDLEEGERHKRFEEAVRAAAMGTLSDEQRRHISEFLDNNKED